MSIRSKLLWNTSGDSTQFNLKSRSPLEKHRLKHKTQDALEIKIKLCHGGAQNNWKNMQIHERIDTVQKNVCFDQIRSDQIYSDQITSDQIWSNQNWSDLIRSDLMKSNYIRPALVWSHLIWSDLSWFDQPRAYLIRWDLIKSDVIWLNSWSEEIRSAHICFVQIRPDHIRSNETSLDQIWYLLWCQHNCSD